MLDASCPVNYVIFNRDVCLISGIVSMILIRTLRRDIAKYNQEDEMVRSPILAE